MLNNKKFSIRKPLCICLTLIVGLYFLPWLSLFWFYTWNDPHAANPKNSYTITVHIYIKGEDVPSDPEKMRKYPFMAYLLSFINNESYNCGGTVIGEKCILTAAHCLLGATNVAVTLGTDDISSQQKSEPTLKNGTLIIHEDFDYKTYDNDIGLICFDHTIPNNDNINTVSLNASQQFNNNNNLPTIVLGWGHVNVTQGLHDELQVKPVKIIDKGSVLNYKDNSKFRAIGNEGPCHGDSGGPLLLGKTQIGILSGGDLNCSTSQPKIYTNVTHYWHWITKKTA